jgi:AcrR family transcriptional regulator
VRIADVAEQADTTEATVLHYFSSKNELINEALIAEETEYQRRLQTDLEAFESPVEKVIYIIESSALHGGEVGWRRWWYLWMETWVRALRVPDVAVAREHLDRSWREFLAAVIHEGQERGEFDVSADPHEVALLLETQMDGLAVQLALNDPEVPSDRMVKLLLAMASRLLGCPDLVAKHSKA